MDQIPIHKLRSPDDISGGRQLLEFTIKNDTVFSTMDDLPSPETNLNQHRHRESAHNALLRCSFILIFSLLVLFLMSFLVLVVAILLGELSISSPISVPSQCRIVSSSVDLRSSKVCELGLLNYKAKHVFYPSERKKFRCHYDYYWASIFKVQYTDHSGQPRLALAEAPNEALPPDCRPNFGAAWLTKDKFKVNETYDCWYTLGISKVNLYQDDYIDCQAKGPSTFEMLERYFMLSTRILMSWFPSSGRAKYWRWDAAAGVVSGFSTSLISITLIRILQEMKSFLPKISAVRMLPRAVYLVYLKRACFLVAYFSCVGWLSIQYGKRIGLSKFF